MRCPFCKQTGDKVVDSRTSGDSIRRRRECNHCNRRFTTYEYVEVIPLVVIKRDGTPEDFQRDKMLKGIAIACNKRPVTRTQIESLVSDIENELALSDSQEISSENLGNLLMQKLYILDQVAYVRFASVYRRFEDAGAFVEEIRSIQE